MKQSPKEQFNPRKKIIYPYNPLRFIDLDWQLQNKEIQEKLANLSSIITKTEQLKLLKIWLNKQKIYPLFKASLYQFSAAKFHQKCDSKPRILVLVQTATGKIIGGYTPLSWNRLNNEKYSEDPNNQSFLFSFNMKQRMYLNKSGTAIRYLEKSGPIFGNGPDLYISDQCDQNEDSSTVFPSAYAYPQNFQTLKQTRKLFCGAQQGYSFKVLEYEVFQVFPEEQKIESHGDAQQKKFKF